MLSTSRRLARHAVRSVLWGVIAALAISLLFGHALWSTLVYSVSIAFCCWMLIDGGRILAARWTHRGRPDASALWPGVPWMAAVIIVGTVLGYSLGNAMGNLVTGLDSPGLLLGDPRQALQLLAIALVPGIAFTYFFYTRERIAVTERRAEAARRLAAQTQLQLLQSQLEPHMLFNTLANLRALIGIDPPRAQLMLDRLIAFLRATLEASRAGSHSLAQEFSRIADYLELMKIRMGERLQVQLELPGTLAQWPVPALLLQPLVENAIKHGLEPKVDTGRLYVSASREADMLVLRVRDTGVGLSVSPVESTRFGLQQVRERLAALHGDAASLQLLPADDADGGAVAIVRLPLARIERVEPNAATLEA